MPIELRKLLDLPNLPQTQKTKTGLERLKVAAADYLRGVAGDMKADGDFANPVWVMQQSGFDPDPWQIEYLRNTADQQAVLCARGSGKSRAVAGRTLSRMLARPGYQALIFSPALRQSKQVLGYIKEMFWALGGPFPVRRDQEACFELWTGSKVTSLPDSQKSVRGPHVDEVVLDEAAQISDVLYKSVRPMIRRRKGCLSALSTPYGKRGWFWTVWDEGKNWHRIKITGAQCGRFTPEELEAEREEMGDMWFAQEYNVEFNESIDAVFRECDIQAALADSSIEPLILGVG